MAEAHKSLKEEMEELESAIMEVRHRIDYRVGELSKLANKAADLKYVFSEYATPIAAAAFGLGIVIGFSLLGRPKSATEKQVPRVNASSHLMRILVPIVTELLLQQIRKTPPAIGRASLSESDERSS